MKSDLSTSITPLSNQEAEESKIVGYQKLESKIEKLEAERQEDRVRNDLKLDLERERLRHELQEEKKLIIKEIQEKMNIVKEIEDKTLAIIKQQAEKVEKEKAEEKNRIIKEKDEERSRSIAIETLYLARIQKLEAEREEERVRNDLKLDRERKILEEERIRYIKLEAKLEENEKKLEMERKDHKRELEEKNNKYETERKQMLTDKDDLIKLVLSPSNKSKKVKNKSETQEVNPSSESMVNNSSTPNININSLAERGGDDSNSESSMEGEEEVVSTNVNALQMIGVNWSTSIKAASILKLRCFLVSLLLCMITFLLLVPLIEKDWGLIQILTNSLDSNLFFVALVMGRFILYLVCHFVIGHTLYDLESMVLFSYTAICWLLVSWLSRFLFPILTARYYDDANIEMSPPAYAKVEMVLLLFMINGVSQVFGNVSLKTFYLYFKKDWMMDEMKQDEKKRNFKYIFITIRCVASVPNLDPYVEILLFGYIFPIVKAAVVTLLSLIVDWYSKLAEWSPEYSAKMASFFSAIAVQVCTLAQLYCVFRGANDPSFFLYQFVPHELIKKLSWLTFHPLYLKTKLQVMHVLNIVYKSACKKKHKVDPVESKTKDRRFSLEVLNSLGAVGGDIFGRQFGEDVCVILITLYMLPISQRYLFPQIYQESSSFSFPTNQSIGVMIIGVAYTLETSLTVFCFAALERAGVPITQNSHLLEARMQAYLCYVCTFIIWILVLTATTVY